jgi:hypothetical protein
LNGNLDETYDEFSAGQSSGSGSGSGDGYGYGYGSGVKDTAKSWRDKLRDQIPGARARIPDIMGFDSNGQARDQGRRNGGGKVIEKDEENAWPGGPGKAQAQAPARVPERGPGAKVKPKARPPPSERTLPKHQYLANGLVKVNSRGQHPIYDLIEMGKEKWQGKLKKASKTLSEAVDEYRRRYARAPPRGFDRW